jgi:hypothetical protein
MSNFLLSLMRNCGVAIMISIFFAGARGPSHPPRTGAAVAWSACDEPGGRVCRLANAEQHMTGRTP